MVTPRPGRSGIAMWPSTASKSSTARPCSIGFAPTEYSRMNEEVAAAEQWSPAANVVAPPQMWAAKRAWCAAHSASLHAVFPAGSYDLTNVSIDESQLDTSKVLALSKVKIKNIDNNMEFQYTLVADSVSDLSQGKLSVSSPIGKGLLGKKVGDVAEIQVPNGLMKFEILDISR